MTRRGDTESWRGFKTSLLECRSESASQATPGSTRPARRSTTGRQIVQPLLNSMLQFTVSEDGRRHGEKYYQTVLEEYRTTRPAFR